jgi:ABC-type Zn uptake system ZnuABC Zn-binding protein ZnuA
VFGERDPDNATLYAANAAAYEQELTELEEEMEAALAAIAPEQRKLVTNHDALAYFARRFDFEVVGTVIPGASTVAEPSAQALVALVEVMRAEGVCTIFAETTANTRLADTVAAELRDCPQVQVRPLYTGALGEPGSGGETYIEMMRRNVEEIVAGLGG